MTKKYCSEIAAALLRKNMEVLYSLYICLSERRKQDEAYNYRALNYQDLTLCMYKLLEGGLGRRCCGGSVNVHERHCSV